MSAAGKPPESPINVTLLPGVGMLVFVVFVGIGVTACLWAWKSFYPDEEEPTFTFAEEDTDKLREAFAEMVGKDELDVYTCFALSLGRYRMHAKHPWRFIPRLVALACVQVLLGILMVAYQIDFSGGDTIFHYVRLYADEQGSIFRMIGAMLFIYSLWRLSDAMQDDCRTWLLHLVVSSNAKRISGWCFWPVLAGECINTFVGFVMQLTLFLIFCRSTRPTDLLINAVAINFVAEIDNQLVRSDEKQEAIEDFEHTVVRVGTARKSGRAENEILKWAVKTFPHINSVMRKVFLLAGALMAFMFSFAHNEALCHRMHQIEPWPFCVGLPWIPGR